MKIDPSEIPGLRNLSLDSFDEITFRSDLPSATTIDLAYGSPDFASLVTAERIGEALTVNAQRSIRYAQGIAGVGIGVPSAIFPGFLDAVGEMAAGRWQSFASGSAKAAIDLGLQTMGALPVIGWAARLAVSLIETLIRASKDRKPPPPNVRYSRDADEEAATMALRRFFAGDLRSVFLPPRVNVRAWRVEPADPGYQVQADGGEQLDPLGTPYGMGVIPGFSVAAGDLRSLTHWPAGSYAGDDAAGQFEGELDKFAIEYVRSRWSQDFAGSVMSVRQLWPSLARVGGSLWSMVSSTKSANAFYLDTRGIADRWDQWSESALVAANDALSGGVRPFMDRIVGFTALQKSTRFRFYGLDSDQSIAVGARQRIEGLRRLQMDLLDSLAVAYASEDQPAFKDQTLAEKLRDRRALLLEHPARWRVDVRDIVDPEFRAAFSAATADQSQRPLKTRTEPGPFQPDPPRGLAPLGSPALPSDGRTVPPWAWALLAAAGVYVASRRR